MNIRLRTTVEPLSFALLFCILLGHTNAFSSELSAGYSSRYVSEGRDNLDGHAIATLTADIGLPSNWSMLIWHGEAAGIPYTESNVALAYNTRFSTIKTQISLNKVYTHQSPDDEEVSIALETSWHALTISLNSVYSNNANGHFHSLFALYDIPINDTFSLTPFIEVAFDNGYASEAVNGHSHNQIGVNTSVSLNNNLNLQGSLAHNMAGKDVKASGQNDTNVASVAITYLF